MKKLINELSKQGELIINYNSANAEILSKVDELVNEYAFLKDYPEYISFLREWSGLTFLFGEDSLSFYGFDSETLDIVNGEGDIIDENGLFIIGDYSYYDDVNDLYKSTGFGIDSTGKREKGIYACNDNREEKLCRDFMELTEILINNWNRINLLEN